MRKRDTRRGCSTHCNANVFSKIQGLVSCYICDINKLLTHQCNHAAQTCSNVVEYWQCDVEAAFRSPKREPWLHLINTAVIAMGMPPLTITTAPPSAFPAHHVSHDMTSFFHVDGKKTPHIVDLTADDSDCEIEGSTCSPKKPRLVQGTLIAGANGFGCIMSRRCPVCDRTLQGPTAMVHVTTCGFKK